MAMAFPATILSVTLFISLCAFTTASLPAGLIITIVNNCPHTIWPAIQPNTGYPVLERGGFALYKLTHRSFVAPRARWSGRIWARTGCVLNHGRFTCATGDCDGRLECNGRGGAAPATLAQFELHQGHADFSTYGLSLVDGFNLPMTLTPHDGKGHCPVVGCRANLLPACPRQLQVRLRARRGRGPVVGCNSGCAAFKTDELCCRNNYNNPLMCKASRYSDFFKHACPSTFTYAHDTPSSLMHECSAARELKIIFCH
ncbi:PREDICTED: osmotin-like protein [Ipomoea nil]|uniref:osmotin-like protein n=1 Tax=Ipomoea nil TaxID=35883 RepID=UPI0009016361|nr:PREDICTED: osmotin-like protein [Ipomoea nil]